MSEKKIKRALRKLDEFGQDDPIEVRYRDGKLYNFFFHRVYEECHWHLLQYANRPSSPDAEYGSKVGPDDFLPTLPLHDLGYIVNLASAKKVCMLPFRKPDEVGNSN